MTDRYVGPGGADGNNGLTWANRKLTLNGVEDTPIVAGDTVYVGPGAYREQLTIDVSGTSGAVITYIADVTGENTDSVGGIVRHTGSTDDTTKNSATNITTAGTARNYRTFRGFAFDSPTAQSILVDGGSANWIIEDCSFVIVNQDVIKFDGAAQAGHIVRRCLFLGARRNARAIIFTHSSEVDNAGHLIENCIFIGCYHTIRIDRVGGITIKNTTVISGWEGISVATALTGGQTITVNNCILVGVQSGGMLKATVTGELIENYNTFWENNSDRTNVLTGANSQTYPPLWSTQNLFDGIIIPPQHLFALSEWSLVGREAGTAESVDDLFGIARPTASAKKSWGPLQLREAERETGTVQTGSAALTLADAGDHQIYVPVTATSTTFEVAARYESEYAGTLPRLIVRQPGQADQVDTMVAAADTWETLSLTFTPNATPPYVVIILRSLNTSVTGDFDTYWDDLDVS